MAAYRMRTIRESLAEIEARGIKGKISKYTIRELSAENRIRHFDNGAKLLVDIDEQIELLVKEQEQRAKKKARG